MANDSRAVAPSGNAVVDSLLIGPAWNTGDLTFSFVAGDMNGNGVPDFEEGDWKEFYREILSGVSAFARIDFTELTGTGNINFRLVEGGGGESGTPAPGVGSVDTVVGIDPDVAGSAAVVRLGTFSETWLHEIGHALGLAHTHEGGQAPLPGVGTPADKGAGNLNSQIYSVMGYTYAFWGEDNPFTPGVDANAELRAQPGSFGAIDIAALQHMYGARAHNTGDDVYRFGDDVDFNRGYTTIWDTGGSDTIAYEGTSRARIDLGAATLKAEVGGGGFLSTSETLTGGFTIAHGVRIENATGGGGDDVIAGNASANRLLGGDGDDVIRGKGGNDRLDGGRGDDTLHGGTGDDTYVVDSARDRVRESAGAGLDTIESTVSRALDANVENLRLLGSGGISGRGNALDNLLVGNAGNNALSGMAGDDVIQGGGGIDRLTGGDGADRFVFASGDTGATVATSDRITDFAAGDRIDLRPIDAVAGGADDAFTLIGTAAFGGVAGQLRYAASGPYTLVSGDTDGDAVADLVIRLDGARALTAADFLL